MGGGFLIGFDPHLFERAAIQVVVGGVRTDAPGADVAQIVDSSGRLFTIYATVPPGTEWEIHEGPFVVAGGVDAPDMDAVTGCPFECRWPEYVAEIAGAVARASDAPTWLLDGNGVIWDARRVDPTALTL
jgi:hypothetical protein